MHKIWLPFFKGRLHLQIGSGFSSIWIPSQMGQIIKKNFLPLKVPVHILSFKEAPDEIEDNDLQHRNTSCAHVSIIWYAANFTYCLSLGVSFNSWNRKWNNKLRTKICSSAALSDPFLSSVPFSSLSLETRSPFLGSESPPAGDLVTSFFLIPLLLEPVPVLLKVLLKPRDLAITCVQSKC